MSLWHVRGVNTSSAELIVAHRTLIARALKGLQDIISVSSVHYTFSDEGWRFPVGDECPGAEPDPLYHSELMRDIYLRANKNYEGRYTVPVLWDKKRETIVNNESRYCTLQMKLILAKSFECSSPRLIPYSLKTNALLSTPNTWRKRSMN
jgi:glutathionyl-hydroquinone reductase